MSQIIDFKKLERKAYLAYHQDGLLDLIIGSILLCLGINEMADSSAFNFIALLLIIAYLPLKRLITYPRIGYVRFNATRGGVNMQAMGVIVLIVLVLALAGIAWLLDSDSALSTRLLLGIRMSPLLLYASIGFIGFGLAGIILGLRRLLIYALLSLVIMIGGHLLHLSLFVALLVLGGAICAIGAILLGTYLRRYPITKGENNDSQ